MSAVVVYFPTDFKASDLGPLRKAIAELANAHGCKVTARNSGLRYDLERVHVRSEVVVPLFKHKPTYNQPWPNPAA